MEIEEIRSRIDALDREIVRLLNERARCAQAVGEAKTRGDSPIYAPDRERQVLDRVAAISEGPLHAADVQAIYREVMSACRGLERRLTVAYWGPRASNTHVAAKKRFGSAVDYLLADSVADVFQQVERGKADVGVVPVENSTEGVIALTLDMFLSSDLKIASEIYVPIQHNLLSRAKSLQDVKRIYTMFQATGQCREWLSRNAASIALVEAGNTARGAGMAADDPEGAAIANPTAAEEYGLGTLAEHIEDNPRNRTRFWVVGRYQPGPSGKDKTSIHFSVPHREGALHQALQAFADHGVSLTFIQSRPTKQTPWEYDFFVDVVGHTAAGPDAPLNRALEQLRGHAHVVRVLGSYPEAEDA